MFHMCDPCDLDVRLQRRPTPTLWSLYTSQSGGLGSFTPSETARMLWSFATLGHTPSQALLGMAPNWAWRLPSSRPVPRGVKVHGEQGRDTDGLEELGPAPLPSRGNVNMP